MHHFPLSSEDFCVLLWIALAQSVYLYPLKMLLFFQMCLSTTEWRNFSSACGAHMIAPVCSLQKELIVCITRSKKKKRLHNLQHHRIYSSPEHQGKMMQTSADLIAKFPIPAKPSSSKVWNKQLKLPISSFQPQDNFATFEPNNF